MQMIGIIGLILLTSIATVLLLETSKTSCYQVIPVQEYSHMRINTCTGETHVVFKDGQGGFEWGLVSEEN